jgi:hypothetical protein
MSAKNTAIVFNGVNGSTGKYLSPPMTFDQIAELARNNFDAPNKKQKDWFGRVNKAKLGHFAPLPEVAVTDLSEAGWGVIFASDCDPSVIEALEPLLEHRKSAAGDRFRRYQGNDGYRPDETNLEFLARHDHAPSAGPVDPEIMPYYLLLVGGPEEIPFAFQYQLDVNYAVGRLALDHPDDYARYAKSVIDAETVGVSRSKSMRFFGVRNEDDPATQSSAKLLVEPLVEIARKHVASKSSGWSIESAIAEEATKDRILRAITEAGGPSFLFTASHGMGYDLGDPNQETLQGALLCQDWPGPNEWTEEIPDKFLLAGSDIATDADVHGLITFHFACYGAGTPEFDDYMMRENRGRTRISDKPFVGALPKRLLSHPRGGALACIGHIERAWSFSFTSGEDKAIVPFRAAVTELMRGIPIGHALESLNSRFAGIATQITQILEDDRTKPADQKTDSETVAWKWVEHNDSRSYVILGDPFVRIVDDKLGKPPVRKKIEPIEVTTPKPAEVSADHETMKKKASEKADLLVGNKQTDTTKMADTKKENPKQPRGTESGAIDSPHRSDYSDVTNYAFVEPATGRRITISPGAEAVDESVPYQVAWKHVSTARSLLGAREVSMTDSGKDAEGRITLTATFVVGEGEETAREYFGIVRSPDGHCLQAHMVAALDDLDAAIIFVRILETAEVSITKKSVDFSIAKRDEPTDLRREPVGRFSVSIPDSYRLHGHRHFVSADGSKSIEVDFADVRTKKSPEPFGNPPINPRTQFGRIEEVSRFLQSPIRYEIPGFVTVGKDAGAAAFTVHKARNLLESNEPKHSETVDIAGRQAEIRFYADEDMDTDPEAETAAFLAELSD